MVVLGFTKDPYDNFQQLTAWHQKYKIKGLFFFQFANYGRYDKNIAIHKNKFKSLIKWVGDYAQIALSASFASLENNTHLKQEKNNLSNLIHRPVTHVRLRYNKVNLPDTYRNLVEAEFTHDYSLGYSYEIGFRAATCTPFYFYDIKLEVQQPLKVHPLLYTTIACLGLKSNKKCLQF